METFPKLFTPGKIGKMTVKNRLVMAPMVRNYADEDGKVTPKYRAHIERIAHGGVGMMILEASYINPAAKGFVNQLGIHTDETIAGIAELADIAHRAGAVIGPQIFHAGRQTASAISGLPPVAPSPIPDPTVNEVPLELTVNEIHQIVNDFAQAARRAKEANCDFVEIHGAHGYLITQFLSPFSNVRQDQYGGSLEGRMRFLVEVIEAVRSQVGPEYPISVRLSADEMVPKGITPNEAVHIAGILQQLRVDALHISAGNYASYELGYMIQPMAIPDAPLIPLAEQVKRAVDIPVIAVGKIRAPQVAEDILQRGQADYIALGRPLLADHDWPRKAEAGRSETIDKCIACNQGCISRLFEQQDVWCTVNPETSREEQFAVPKPEQAKRVVVIGAGPAGMEAAKVAAGRGHHVTVFEALDHTGGQLIAAAAAPYRPGWRELHAYLDGEMQRLKIDMRLGQKVDADQVVAEGADAAIIAIGATPIRLQIPGVEGANVVFARDLLEGHAEAKGRVVIAGGGCSGAQTAEYLASRGFPVTIVEMLGAIAADSPRAERELLLKRLQDYGVKIQMETRIMRVEEHGVVVERPGGLEEMPADTVVLCLGAMPNDGIAEELRMHSIPVMVVGDAVKPRKVTEAMVEGALAGLSC